MLKNLWVLLVTPLLFGLNGCLTSDWGLSASAGVFQATMTGDTGREGNVLGLADVDIDDDLDLSDEDNSIFAKARVSGAGINIWASGFETEQNGRSQLSVNFGDIAAGTTVRTNSEIRSLQAGISFNIIDVGGFRLAPGVGADYFDIELEAQDSVLNQIESLAEDGPIPLVFLDASFDPPVIPLSVEAHIGGITGTYDDFDGLLLDGEATVHVHLLDPLDLYAGYRYIQFELDGVDDGEEFTADLVLSGLIVGAGLRF